MVSLVPLGTPTAPTKVSKPTKPLLRRSTLSGTIRKFEDTDLDSDLLSVPPSPNKRARVTFNPKVEEKYVDEFSVKGRSLDLIRSEVKRAIEGHAKGNSEAYDNIKSLFCSKTQDEDDEDVEEQRRAEIKTYIIALTSYTSLLNSNCSGLVKSLIHFQWLGRDESSVKAYIHFLGSLASAQGAYVGMILGTLVDNFAGVRLSSGRLIGYPDVSREQLTSRVHVALKYLLRLVPSASGILSPIISKKFPFSDETKKIHVTYIQNLMRLIEYAPELKSDTFALITDKLVKIDVQMQVNLEDLDDDVSAAIVSAVINATHRDEEAGEISQSESDPDSSDDEDLSSDMKQLKEVQANVEVMDAILDLLFNVYTPYFEDPNSIEAANMFETLISHFTNIILPTYRSRHTQFLLFHFAQKADHLVDLFAGTCVQLAFEAGQPAVLKQSAAAYLASFVARGAHVESHVVQTVFELIGSNLNHLRQENEATCRGPDLKRYTTFYAMTQALLYIFCFRWRDLIAPTELLEENDPLAFVGQNLEWIPGVKETLHNAIYSKLNPLKICSPPIVSEFAKIANHLRFLYVYPLLETNKRIRLSQFVSKNGALRDTGNGNNDSWHQLDAYFPFDPYQLPVSKKWVEGDYVMWKGVPGLDQDEDDEDETADEDEEEEADVDEETATDEEDDE
ncbi:RNA polymerase I-specific transcription initiation factor-like protein rrn3 [Tricladium varicosporioides]|nr:RNA polymerase I-specific transcription initiation factor-like protein rrn3 [Hymenoscyphus varicosporioides]